MALASAEGKEGLLDWTSVQVDWCASDGGYRSGQTLSIVKICGT